METLLTIVNYLLRIFPGLILIALFLFFIKPSANLRIIVYIFTFVVMRDAMTPLGLWSLGKEKEVLWIRLSTDPLFLILFGIFSLLVMLALAKFDKENRKHLVWFQNSKWMGSFFGIVGCIVVVLPLFIIYQGLDLNLRGGPVDTPLLAPILLFVTLGNFFEEGLFRGYVLGYLKIKQRPIIAGINSGLIFAFCHIFLALTVTNIGFPLLVFAFWEGVIAGLIGTKYGIIPATITHGGAIFLLSSGII